MHTDASASSSSEISGKKLRANRRNARRSTGPRTQEGKEKSKMNATTHMFFCQDLVLPGEIAGNMEYIREQHLESLKPQTIDELFLVDRIVSAAWKLNRLQRSELHMHQAVEGDMQRGALINLAKARGKSDSPHMQKFTAEMLELSKAELEPSASVAIAISADDGCFEKLNRFEQRLENMIHRCRNQLRAIRKAAGVDVNALPPSPYSKKQLETLDERYEQWCDKRESKTGIRPPPLEPALIEPQTPDSERSEEPDASPALPTLDSLATARAVSAYKDAREQRPTPADCSNVQNEPTDPKTGVTPELNEIYKRLVKEGYEREARRRILHQTQPPPRAISSSPERLET